MSELTPKNCQCLCDSLEDHLKKQLRLVTDRLEKRSDDIDKLYVESNRYKKALKEIIKGEGPYSMDHLQHASNTIEAMKDLAKQALSKEAGRDE